MFRATRALTQQRQPLIRFLGRRTVPKDIDHSPKAHPAAPSGSLPDSFASYRQRTTQHGPLHASPSLNAGHGQSGSSLGSVAPEKGVYFDRDELPARFRRTLMPLEEIEAIETGGASLHA